MERRPLGAVRLRSIALQAGLATAAFHRRRLTDVSFIGVTGSCGKTTTKELIAAILSPRVPGRKSPGTANTYTDVGKTVLRTRSDDAFCVVEIAAWEPGSVARAAAVVQPDIAVVTNVGADHRKAFRSLDVTAAEKARLLDALVAGGTAVLNADDDRVGAMAHSFPGSVITFGRSSEASLRAENIRARWPGRLSFTLHAAGRSHEVRTRLYGEHSLPSALAALGAAQAFGIPPESAIAALCEAPPTPSRMSPVVLDGVTFIRDDAKAPLWTFDAVFKFLAEARAARKLAVIGTIADYSNPASRVYPSVARRAFGVADEVLFVGPMARHALRARRDPHQLPVRAFGTAEGAARHLKAILRDGDLVLVKGIPKDRLDSVLSSRKPGRQFGSDSTRPAVGAGPKFTPPVQRPPRPPGPN